MVLFQQVDLYTGCRYSDSPNCNYCGELDDLTNIFVTYSRLSGLFQLTQNLIRKLNINTNNVYNSCLVVYY